MGLSRRLQRPGILHRPGGRRPQKPTRLAGRRRQLHQAGAHLDRPAADLRPPGAAARCGRRALHPQGRLRRSARDSLAAPGAGAAALRRPRLHPLGQLPPQVGRRPARLRPGPHDPLLHGGRGDQAAAALLLRRALQRPVQAAQAPRPRQRRRAARPADAQYRYQRRLPFLTPLRP